MLSLFPKLVSCPQEPEESWRRTDPELFFLPEGEILNVQGAPYTEHKTSPLPWKVHFRSPSDALAKLDFVPSALQVILSAESKRLVLLNVGAGHVDVYLAQELRSQIDFQSRPWEPSAVAHTSDIGFALASRLHASSPHQVVVTLNTQANEVPLVVVCNQNSPSFAQSYTNLKLILNAKSQADLVWFDFGAAFSYLRHEIELQEDAVLNQLWVKSLVPHAQPTALLERVVNLKKGARFADAHVFAAQQGTMRVTSNLVFDAQKAQARSSGVIVGLGGKVDYEPIQDHRVSQSKSHVSLKMLLTKKARAIFQGLVVIRKDAQACEALQENRNLLLSPQARADALPRLEILPNDVVCKHGSATGELDATQLYYLMSRGLSPLQARKMIIASFAKGALTAFAPEHILACLAAEFLDTLSLEQE